MARSPLDRSVSTPRELFDLLRESVLRLDSKEQAALFADDVVVELPFAPDGFPRRIDGRAAFYVQRLRVRNGQIIEFRDYWPPQTAAVAALTVGAPS